MNCTEHNDRSAVSTCALCGAGLCNDCASGSAFRNNNNQPFCKKCNYEIARENDRSWNALLKSKQLTVCIYGGAFALGMILVSILEAIGYKASIFVLLACQALGFVVSCILDKGKNLREAVNDSIKAEKTFLNKLARSVGTVIGPILLMPISIVLYLIGILRVKKQIADNNKVLNRLRVETSQN